MSHLRNTFVGLAFAYLQIAVNLVQGLIITPMCLAYVPEATFGAWLVTGNLLGWVSILDPGVHLVIQQRIAMAYARGDVFALGRLRMQAYTLASVFAAGALAASVLATPLHSLLVRRLDCEQPANVTLAYLIAATALAIFIASYGAAVVTLGTQAPAVHGMIALVAQATHLAVAIFLLQSGFGIVALALGLLVQAVVNLTGNLVYAFMTMPALAWPSRTSVEGMSSLVRDTRSVFMGRAGAALASNCDMIIASWFLGASATVSLSVTQRAPLVLRTLTERVSHSATPVLSAIDAERGKLGRGDATATVVRMAIWLSIPAAVAIVLWNRLFVSLWAGQDLYTGDGVNALIAVGVLAVSLETTFLNLCAALGLYAASGQLLLVKSLVGLAAACVGARFFGVIGLLAGPLIAGAVTTWWVLPMVLGGYSGWNLKHWSCFVVESLKGLGAAAAAAAGAMIMEASDLFGLAAAGAIFTVIYAGCLFFLSADLRGLVSRAGGLVGSLKRFTP